MKPNISPIWAGLMMVPSTSPKQEKVPAASSVMAKRLPRRPRGCAPETKGRKACARFSKDERHAYLTAPSGAFNARLAKWNSDVLADPLQKPGFAERREIFRLGEIYVQ